MWNMKFQNNFVTGAIIWVIQLANTNKEIYHNLIINFKQFKVIFIIAGSHFPLIQREKIPIKSANSIRY